MPAFSEESKPFYTVSYLALRPGPHAREQIIDLFWPEMDLPDGRNNLSTALSGLRRQLEPPGVRKGAVLVTTHAQAGLDPAAVSTDVAEFERLLRNAERAGEPKERVGLLAGALALYGGSFQPGNYQDWAVRESERLEARRVAALDALADDLETLGHYAEAVSATRQRLEADPYAEAVQIGLIRRLVGSGQSGAARKAAQEFEQLFREEFGAGLDTETRRAIEEILAQPVLLPASVPSAQTSFLSQTPITAGLTEPKQEDTPPVQEKAALPFWLNRLPPCFCQPKMIPATPVFTAIPPGWSRWLGRAARARRAWPPSSDAGLRNASGTGAALSHWRTSVGRTRFQTGSHSLCT